MKDGRVTSEEAQNAKRDRYVLLADPGGVEKKVQDSRNRMISLELLLYEQQNIRDILHETRLKGGYIDLRLTPHNGVVMYRFYWYPENQQPPRTFDVMTYWDADRIARGMHSLWAHAPW